MTQSNPGSIDISAGYIQGVVVLSGKVDSSAAVENAILLASHIKGESEVD